MQEMTIGKKKVGPGCDPFIVAEVSCNHRQKLELAEKIIEAAAKAGADAVKLQTYTPDTMTIDSNKKWFLVESSNNPEPWQGKTLYHLYKEAYTPWSWHKHLQLYAKSLGLEFFSTPFDGTAVDFLEQLDVPCYKIASYECTDLPLLQKIAETKKPIIMSVGFASLHEVEESIAWLRNKGVGDLIILYCMTSYQETGDTFHTNLQTMLDIQKRFDVVVGFSDNMGGIDIPIFAASCGAAVIEKHLVLQHEPEILDDRFSLDPMEFQMMVERIRAHVVPHDAFWQNNVLGSVQYGCQTAAEEANKRYRRSIFVIDDMQKGDLFTKDTVACIRPHFGLAPKYYFDVLDKKAACFIERGTPLSWDLIENTLVLRPVVAEDVDTILSWRNEPHARLSSFSSKEISFNEHRAYWMMRLKSSTFSFIVTQHSQDIGIVRLDPHADGVEVHILIGKEFRGHGFGSMALAKVKEWAQRMHFKKLFARIKPENTASIHLFEDSGFVKADDFYELVV